MISLIHDLGVLMVGIGAWEVVRTFYGIWRELF